MQRMTERQKPRSHVHTCTRSSVLGLIKIHDVVLRRTRSCQLSPHGPGRLPNAASGPTPSSRLHTEPSSNRSRRWTIQYDLYPPCGRDPFFSCMSMIKVLLLSCLRSGVEEGMIGHINPRDQTGLHRYKIGRMTFYIRVQYIRIVDVFSTSTEYLLRYRHCT